MDTKKILILTAIEMEAQAVPGSIAIGIRASRLSSLEVPTDITVVILCGLAGALNPDLAIGDLILEDRANVVPTTVPIRRGTIHTATEIIATPLQKADLFRGTHADAVDMEQSIVQAWCDQRGIPLIGLRAISDTASETLNPAIAGFVDDLGRSKPAKLAMGLLRRPALIPELMRLNNAAKLALDRLSMAVKLLM